ncbi:MAG: cation efflux protein, CzcI family [Rhizobacter sp.]
MRRLLTILLLLVLPLQFSWAAAAAYCQHERAADAAGHVGHHEHRHVEASPQTPEKKSTTETSVCLDDDCAFCHLGCGKTVGSTVSLLDVAGDTTFTSRHTPPVGTPLPSRIERPNWRAG